MRYIAIVNEWNWFHQNLWLDSSTGKKNPLKYAPVPKCGFVAQLLVAPALYLGDVGSNHVEAWIFFTFLCCNCLNCSSFTYIQGWLLYTIFTRRLNKIYSLKKIMESNTNDFSTYLGVYRQPVLSLSSHRAQAFCFVSTWYSYTVSYKKNRVHYSHSVFHKEVCYEQGCNICQYINLVHWCQVCQSSNIYNFHATMSSFFLS